MIRPIIFFVCLLSILIAGCNNDIAQISSPQVEPKEFLKGWEITAKATDFGYPRGMFFVNSEIGFVVGYEGSILKTTNGGQTWEKKNSGTSLGLLSVYFLNSNVGFAAGQAGNCLDDDCGKGGIVLKTIDGGENWTKTFSKDFGSFYSLHFLDESTGLSTVSTIDARNSRYYHIARTIDGGNNWDLIDIPIIDYQELHFTDDVVFLAGQNGEIYKSSNFGDSFETIGTSIRDWNFIRGMYFINKNVGFLDGTGEIFKTMDGGLHWKGINSPFDVLEMTHFYSESEGFNIEMVSVYDGGDFPTFKGCISYQTINNESSWVKSDLTNSFFPQLFCFPQSDLGYAISNSQFYTIKRK